MQESLQQRIKNVIALTGMTYTELAMRLGVSKDNLYKWKVSSNPRSYEDLERINKGLNQILENISTQHAEAPSVKSVASTKKPLMVSIFLNTDEAPEVYTEEKAIPGSVIEIDGKTALIAYRNSSPVIGNVDGLITVAGNSMLPTFKSGDMIGVTKLKFNKILVAGHYYFIIDSNNVGVLRKIIMRQEDQELLLMSENEEYPSFVRSFEDIKAIFKVDTVVSKH